MNASKAMHVISFRTSSYFFIGFLLWVTLHHVPDVRSEQVYAQRQKSNRSAASVHDFGRIHSFFTLSTGLRTDELEWNIAGNINGNNPNILSELDWANLQSYQVSLENRTIMDKWLYLRGYVNMAWIQNGTVRDSDYDGDNRTDEFSRSISETDADYLFDLSLGIGPRFSYSNSRVSLSPLLGYSLHRQNLRITNGEQMITWPDGPDLGPIEGLNSTYQTEWKGPWLGCDLHFEIPSRSGVLKPVELGFSIEYHWVDYNAEANWNLRSSFQHPKSFEHEADGNGIVFKMYALTPLSRHWALSFSGQTQHWTTGHGIDRVYLSSGDISSTRLNEVEWKSFSLMAGVVFVF